MAPCMWNVGVATGSFGMTRVLEYQDLGILEQESLPLAGLFFILHPQYFFIHTPFLLTLILLLANLAITK